MPKFFADNEVCNDYIELVDEAKHIQVLRYKVGDEIIIGDGKGYDYICTIEKIEKNKVISRINVKNKCLSEPDVSITLFQALPKSSKMENIITQNIEMGVKEIVPIETKFTIAKSKDNKIDRWQKIAESSSKQSMRGIIPKIHKTISLKESLEYNDFDLKIVAYEKEKNLRIIDVLNKNIKKIALYIGSEGGFSLDEIELFKENNFKIITLGERILRTETAGIACTSVIVNIT
ncbi:MAG: RsmE family RNA methyltransferase [Lachnospirales bacterium]